MVEVDVDGTEVILVTEIGDAEADPIQGIIGTGAGAIQGDEEEVAARIGASPEAEAKKKTTSAMTPINISINFTFNFQYYNLRLFKMQINVP